MTQSYNVRDVAPDILLFANLGAVQLNYGFGVKECLAAVNNVGADALILHLNPLQEAFQPGGNTNFKGLLGKIRQVCRELPVPVIIKEVGWGISENTAALLAGVGVAGIDVAGSGGTCWSEIESRRGDESTARAASNFVTWGIPTAESIVDDPQGCSRNSAYCQRGHQDGPGYSQSYRSRRGRGRFSHAFTQTG